MKPASRAPAACSEALAEMAAVVGRRWADASRRNLQREGRLVAGGWPGTISEARARVQEMLLLGRAAQRGSALDVGDAEREAVVRALYRSARTEWRCPSAPEDPC